MPALIKEFYKDYPLQPTLAKWTQYKGKQLLPDTNIRKTIAENSKLKST